MCASSFVLRIVVLCTARREWRKKKYMRIRLDFGPAMNDRSGIIPYFVDDDCARI